MAYHYSFNATGNVLCLWHDKHHSTNVITEVVPECTIGYTVESNYNTFYANKESNGQNMKYANL